MKSSTAVQRFQKLGLLLAIVGVIGLTPGSVNAAASWLSEDVSKGVFSIGGRAMYFDPKDGENNWFGGAQVRAYLGEAFAIEGSADYRENDFGDTTVRTFPVQASALLYLIPGKRISPYVLGGAGWYFTNIDGPNGSDDTDHRFGLHAGGGLQVMLDTNWSIDSSYRYVWIEKIESEKKNLTDKDFRDRGHMITIGLNYHF